MNIVTTRKDDGSMDVRKDERPEPPEELAKIAYATLEELEGAKA